MNHPALAEDIFAQPIPDFLPERVRRACRGKRVTFKVHKGLRECMQVPDDLTVSEWAERHRRVTAIDAHPGKWRNELVPHAVHIMDIISQPHVRKVWLCMVERAGKTNIILNAALWKLDRGVDSGNIFWLMPNESEAKKALGERIIPVLKETPRIARLLSRYHDDTTRTMVRFKHGPRLFPAWAQSAASVSSFFGGLNIADEIDKAETKGVGTETDILTLFEKRGRDREDSKFLYASTPAGRFIYKGTMRCQHVWGFFSRCPHCGEHIVMDEEHFDFPADATVEDLKEGLHEVFYSCNACGGLWDQAARQDAYENGRWQLIKGQQIERAVTVGVHLPAFPLPNIPMGEIAAAIQRAKSGDIEGKKDLAHGYKAVDYENESVDRKEEQILRLRDDRPEGLVPSVPIAAITAVADMQKRGFWFKITAWGYGLEQESWLLRCGYVDSWEALRKLFYETEFRDVHGNRYVVTLRGLDSGGGESEQYADLSRTAEAYLFACANPGIALFKGQRTMANPYMKSNRDRLPGTNKPLPGAVLFYNVNSKHYKDQLAAKVLVEPANPGAWHLHSGYTADQLQLLQRDPSAKIEHSLGPLAKQMCVEGKDDKGGFWINPKKRDNHLWDCSYMELALVDIAQVKFWKQPEAKPAQGGRRVLSPGV